MCCNNPKILIVLIVLCFSWNHLYAQNNLWDVLKQIKMANSGQEVTYEYDVYLINRKNNMDTRVDSIKGRFYKDGIKYIDSNNSQITVFDGKFYCKINKDLEDVYLYDVDYLSDKLELSLDSGMSSLIAMPDSSILAHSSTKLDFRDNNIIVRITFKQGHFGFIEIEMDKSSFHIKKMKIESYAQKSSEGNVELKVYFLNNIRFKVNSTSMNFSRFYTVRDHKPKAALPYSKFKLTSFTE